MVRLIKSSSLVVILAAVVLALRVYSSPPPLPRTVGSESGSITGRVWGADGRRIVNALVMAELTGAPSVTLPQTDTDRNGNFRLENLTPGVYILHSRKEDEGYPRSEFDFYAEGARNEPQVLVYANQTTPNVTIQRTKAALLKGHIIDGATGKPPLENPAVLLRQEVDSERFLRLGAVKGEFQILVPSLAITLKIEAPGYEDWHYRTPEGGNCDGVFLLAPETTQELDIVMRRKKPIR